MRKEEHQLSVDYMYRYRIDLYLRGHTSKSVISTIVILLSHCLCLLFHLRFQTLLTQCASNLSTITCNNRPKKQSTRYVDASAVTFEIGILSVELLVIWLTQPQRL